MIKLRDLVQNEMIDHSGDLDVAVKIISTDSRAIKPGAMFVALKGEKFDGNAYLNDALARGAVAVVSDEPPLTGITVAWVQVEDARKSLAAIAKAFYRKPDEAMTLVGITGTNGKTTTAHVISSLMQTLNGPCGVLGTVDHKLGNRSVQARLTTPESHENLMMLAEMRDSGCKSAVMEASSVGIHRHRVRGFDWDALVFTNFTRDHLDYHGSMEEYFAAKKALFTAYSGKMPVAILNVDDPAIAALEKEIDLPVISFGKSEDADLRLISSKLDSRKSELKLSWKGAAIELTTRLIGQFNIYNLMAGLATVFGMGYSVKDVVALVPGIDAVRGRLEPIDLDKPYRVLIDYAHTDDALLKLLEAAREITKGRLVVLFGCGGDRDATKRPAMGAHAVTLADLAVLTSDNPRTEKPEKIIDDVLEGINNVENPKAELHVEIDRKKAIAWTLEQAEEGDMILLAGKGHEPYQIIGTETFPFDEREIVREILEKR